MQEHRSVQGSFDLHTHSVYSDGSQSVQALIAEARERGLSGIAITDHDSLRQLSSVRAEARKMGFPVIAGVEASCIDSETGRKIHILCYGLAATADESGPLELLVNETLARRTANTLWQAWTLERKGMAPLRAKSIGGRRGRSLAGKYWCLQTACHAGAYGAGLSRWRISVRLSSAI